jgi:hypothetical protein
MPRRMAMLLAAHEACWDSSIGDPLNVVRKLHMVPELPMFPASVGKRDMDRIKGDRFNITR